MSDNVLLTYSTLKNFCTAVYEKCGLSHEDAELASDVLTMADLRGIPSHGVARLRRYVNGLKTGQMLPKAKSCTVKKNRSSVIIDANGGMGAPVSVRTMRQVIDKARKNGAAFGCVFNSNHFGIAGYYAQMAAETNMIGITMTNTAALGVPTFGRQVMFGTNPLSGAYAYSAAKAAVENHTRAMARELAPYHIRVNALAPGFFLGKQNHNLLINDDDSLTERGKSIISRTPFGRFGQAEELCGAAIFLVASASGFVSGATIPIDGAYLCNNI